MPTVHRVSARACHRRAARRRDAWALFCLVALVVAAAVLAFADTPQPQPPAAVTPAAGDATASPAPRVIALIESAFGVQAPDLQPLQAGLAHMLMSDLAAYPQVRVVSRERVSGLLAEVHLGEMIAPSDQARAARAVRADTVLMVKVSGSPKELLCTMQLLKSPTETAWSQEFRGAGSDLPALEQQMLGVLRERLELGELKAKSAPAGQPATLAVFDFEPAGPVAELDKHGGDLAELLTTYLSSSGVQLVERQRLAPVLKERAVILAQRSGGDEAWLGRLLGAQRFLYTTMVQWGQQVRFDCHLVDPQTGVVIATASTQGPIAQAPALLEDLARQVAGRLSLSGEAPPAAPKAGEALPLEAAIHFARGKEYIRQPDYDKAIPEFERAAYLAPDNGDVWKVLADACLDSKQYDRTVEYAKAFLSRQPDTPNGDLRWCVNLAEQGRKNWPGLEAAARGLLADTQSRVDGRVAFASQMLSHALIEQGKWEEAFCEAERAAAQVPADEAATVWSGILGSVELGVAKRRGSEEEPAPGAVAIVGQVVDAAALSPELDNILACVMFWPLLHHCVGNWTPGPDLYQGEARDLEAGLAVAERAAERFKQGNRIPAMAGMVRAMLLARLNRPEDALEALRGVLRDYPTADVDEYGYISLTPPANGMVHFYIGLINDHLGRRTEAAAAYREAVAILNPNRRSAQMALARLQEWKAPLPPEVPWERRVQCYPHFQWVTPDRDLIDWLRTHDYSLWMSGISQENLRLGVSGTLVLVYRGMTPEIPSAEDLRAWVAHGGRLLLLCRRPGYEEVRPGIVLSSRRSLDQTLNWVLEQFGMRMDPSSTWTKVKMPLAPTAHPMTQGMAASAYSGLYWPLLCPPEASALRLTDLDAAAGTGGREAVVGAAREFGLGRVAVVTLRDWFPCGDRQDWTRKHDPWEDPLFARVMAWLTRPQSDPAKQKLVERFAKAWDATMAYYPRGGLEQFEGLTLSPGLSGQEAKYLVARILERTYRWVTWQAPSPLPLFQELARSGGEAWLRRASALWAARVLRHDKKPKQALEHYRAAAAVSGDALWASAVVEQGDVALEQGDSKAAEARFCEVASIYGHSEERIRALFGLGYALERQRRFADAVRVYGVIADEYGKARLPPFLDDDWCDPWQWYWPRSARQGEYGTSFPVMTAVQYRLSEMEKAEKGGGKQSVTKKSERPE